MALYNNVDVLSKTVHNIGLHLSIFKLENEKFALIIDSTTKIYKFIEGNYQQIISTNSRFAFGTNIKIEQKKLNLDKFKDVLIEIPSGGTAGSEFLFLFYNSSTKSFDYDAETELRNIEFNKRYHGYFCIRNGKLLIVNDKLIEYLIIKPLDEALVQVIYFSFLRYFCAFVCSQTNFSLPQKRHFVL